MAVFLAEATTQVGNPEAPRHRRLSRLLEGRDLDLQVPPPPPHVHALGHTRANLPGGAAPRVPLPPALHAAQPLSARQYAVMQLAFVSGTGSGQI